MHEKLEWHLMSERVQSGDPRMIDEYDVFES